MQRCDICGRWFTSNRAVAIHKGRVHREQDKEE